MPVKVAITNKLPQVLMVGLLTENGNPIVYRLSGRSSIGPFDRNQLTEYVRQLAKRGTVQLRYGDLAVQ